GIWTGIQPRTNTSSFAMIRKSGSRPKKRDRRPTPKGGGRSLPVVLILHETPTTYRDFIQDRFPGLQLEICTDFVNAGDILRRVEPAIVLAAKSKRQTFPRDALVSAPSVRWIHSTSAGIDHLVPWDKKRLSVTNSRGLFGDAMAQYVMSMV